LKINIAEFLKGVEVKIDFAGLRPRKAFFGQIIMFNQVFAIAELIKSEPGIMPGLRKTKLKNFLLMIDR